MATILSPVLNFIASIPLFLHLIPHSIAGIATGYFLITCIYKIPNQNEPTLSIDEKLESSGDGQAC
ncbi:hypothetical protein [Desulfuribacillus stibiiarsenatis]|uniref:hypothetical protein n=1 Tax=Desulfuribacillus stibiiarsenatis TaxID=1390249 RepID=UPI00159F0D98|nr:hypothetical protein [Desulfuribacillus stibiiarsenatis]